MSKNKVIQDPGIGVSGAKKPSRIISADGEFNVKLKGADIKWRDVYKWLIDISWPSFFLLMFAGYLTATFIFIAIYSIDFNGLKGIDDEHVFRDLFVFSFQTFTTVGYGNMVPESTYITVMSGCQAFVGLIGFALITGLFYGRFSKPNLKIIYSENALLSSVEDRPAFVFKIANKRNNVLINVRSQVMVVINDNRDGSYKRRFHRLSLQIDQINFMPSTWTLVHFMDEDSPLKDIPREVLQSTNTEFIVMITAYDETYGQELHTQHSYLGGEIIANAHFERSFFTNEKGETVVNLDEISKFKYD